MFIEVLVAAALASPVERSDAWVAQASANHPAVAASAARGEAAQARAGAVGRWPDPVLMLQYVGPWTTGWIGDHPMAGIDARVTQRLLPHRWSRAQRAVEVARADGHELTADATRRALEGRLGTAWWRVAAADAHREVLVALRADAAVALASVQGRYGVGRADDTALLRLELFLEDVSQQLDDVAADRAAAMAELTAVGGFDMVPAPILPSVPAPLPELPDVEPPSVARIEADAQALDARAAAVRSERGPPVDVWFGVRGRTFASTTDPGVDLFMVGASVPVPVGRLARARRGEEALRSEARAVRADALAHEDAVRGHAQAVWADWERAVSRAARLDAERIPLATSLRASVRDAFAAGRASGLDLHAAERDLLALSRARIDAVASTWMARAELAALVGVSPQELDP